MIGDFAKQTSSLWPQRLQKPYGKTTMEFSHGKMHELNGDCAILSIVILNYQMVKPPFSHGFPMIFHSYVMLVITRG